ncbi:MAG: hypothetical protein ABIF01_00985 [Candidatus Micrarchaeota archaeon]
MGGPGAAVITAPKQETDYSIYVQNTIDFTKKLDACKTDQEKAMAVREYMEGGGLRSGLKPVSERKYSSVLYFPEGASFQVGTSVVKSGGSQSTIPTIVTIPTGSLVEFEYNTEKGAALTFLNSNQEIVRISLGGQHGAPLTVNPTEQHTLNIFFKSIKSTAKLYENNREFAGFMEQSVDALYGVGHKVSKHKGPYMATMQSTVGLTAMKSALRGRSPVYGPIGQAKDQTVSDWTHKVYEMVNPKSTAGAIDWAIVDNQAQVQEIMRELKLEDDEISNFYVGFGVKNGKPVMNVFSYMDLEKESTEFKPVLMYQVQSGGQGLNVSFDNVFKLQRGGNIADGYRKDYDNLKVVGETSAEAALKDIYNKENRTTWDREVHVFAVNVVIPEDQFAKFAKSFTDEFKRLSQ